MRTLLMVAVCVLTMTAPSRAQIRAEDKVSSSQLWKAIDPTARAMYVEGFKDGSYRTYAEIVAPGEGGSELPPEWVEAANSVHIADVMSDLYRDPANVNILMTTMVLIARDKLAGKNVSQMIEKAREDGAYVRGLHAKPRR